MCFGTSAKPSEASRHLEEAARDLLDLVDRFAGTKAATLEEYKLLERLLAEHCEVKNDDTPGHGGGRKLALKDPRQVEGTSLQNPSDPDATYNGHKGYMMQVMETYTEKADADAAASDDIAGKETPTPNLITYVSLNGMTDYDGDALVPALEQTAQRGIAPQQLLGDTHYGTATNPTLAAERGVELIAPAQPGKGSAQEKPQLEDFDLNADGRVTHCPAGHVPISVSNTEKNYQARFAAAVCAGCPLRDGCPVQKPRPTDAQATRLQYDKPRLQMYERRRREQEAAFKERYRWRAGIEGTMSRLKHVVGLGALRVRGYVAVRYEAFMGALGLNILRCAAAQ
jgi:hypothetical protein